MNKVMYCPDCEDFVTVDIYSNVDFLTFMCPVCNTVVGAEAHPEGPTVNSEVVAMLSEESRETICAPCQCGEGCVSLSVREIKELIKDTNEQIDQLTNAASDLLVYRYELEELIA